MKKTESGIQISQQILGTKVCNFKIRTKIESAIFDVGSLSGNVMDYPFDNYKAEIAFKSEETNTTNSIPIMIGAYISHSNLKMNLYFC